MTISMIMASIIVAITYYYNTITYYYILLHIVTGIITGIVTGLMVVITFTYLLYL